MNKKNENTNVNEKSCVIKTYVIHLKQLLHYPSFIFWWRTDFKSKLSSDQKYYTKSL